MIVVDKKVGLFVFSLQKWENLKHISFISYYTSLKVSEDSKLIDLEFCFDFYKRYKRNKMAYLKFIF